MNLKAFKELYAQIEAKNPAFLKQCVPRRIIPPNGYVNPKYYTVCMACAVHVAHEHDRLQDMTHYVLRMVPHHLRKNSVPTYFVAEELCQSVGATEPPDGLLFEEIRMARPAMILALPERFSRAYFGFDVPWLATALVKAGRHVDVAEAGIDITRDSWLLHAPMALNETYVDYTAGYHMDQTLGQRHDSKFVDSTKLEWAGHKPPSEWEETAKPKDDAAFVSKLVGFTVNLLMVMSERRFLIEEGVVAHQPKAHGKPIEGATLWHPSIIGRVYRIHREGHGGKHASPEMHWRRGHWAYVARRKGAGFVSVTDLPRREDGTIDWANASAETRELFWTCHERKWIEMTLVNAPESEADKTNKQKESV